MNQTGYYDNRSYSKNDNSKIENSMVDVTANKNDFTYDEGKKPN